jgi:hypothetical protein
MKLLALAGLDHQWKEAVTVQLARALQAAGRSVAVLDNGDQPLRFDGVPHLRLAGGCVCCTLAARLAPALQRFDADVVLLPVSAAAQPGMLRQMLDLLRGPHLDVALLGLLRQADAQHHPYFAAQLSLHVDATLSDCGLLETLYATYL